MPIRIIAGEFRGRILKVSARAELRPSSARLREALFSILGGDLRDDRVLDLFSGTGAVGFEALSRGATQVAVVESDTTAAKALEKNRRALGCSTVEFEIYLRDAIDAIRQFDTEGRKFELIFADPPYAYDRLDELIEEIAQSELLASDGILIVEHTLKRELVTPESLKFFREETYGDSRISFFRRPIVTD